MSNFKYRVGDKVRVRSNLNYGLIQMENNSHLGWCAITPMRDFCGQIVTISEINEVDQCYHIKEMREKLRWTDGMFEGKTMFTKRDLKNGDVIVRHDGRVEIVNVDLGMLICERGWNNLDDVMEDFTDCDYGNHFYCEGEKYNIDKVYRPIKKYQCSFYNYKSGELVYDRERDTKPIEPPKPLYNGKVVCIDNTKASRYTVGKIYEFKNGELFDKDVKLANAREIHSFNEWENLTNGKFLEIKE